MRAMMSRRGCTPSDAALELVHALHASAVGSAEARPA
jgi:hypothetical protein